MKLLVMSDTHSDAAVITNVIAQNPDVDGPMRLGN